MSHEDRWLPTYKRMTMEVIATMVGVIGASLIISRIPAIKALVDGNSIWALDNPNASGTSTSSTS
jgi:hypothetical protein